MRYGVLGDIHANLEALEAVIDACKSEDIRQYLCVGDVVGYATNPNECVEKIKLLCSVTVAGNHDWASVNLLPEDYFNPFAKEAIRWTRRNLNNASTAFLESLKLFFVNDDLTLVHGTLNDPQDFYYMTDEFTARETFRLLENNICFLGHTHLPGIFIRDKDGLISYTHDTTIAIVKENQYIVNVGSIGQPRDRNPDSAYCTYDTDTRKVQIKRVTYNRQKVESKIIAAGLPRFLGERLLVGR